ncbi:MAG: MscL family protein [Candidatus Methanofastidiosa archaeon]|nr:MscL family protein [Candidatus Methanofastidiosa archaeon]MDD4281638.1 MscL family protein [Candidatus Methanofastidiosa archaeon]
MKEEEMLAELKQIRTLLTPAPTPPPAAPVGMKDEFMAFVKKYKLLGMAVAFIIAIYLGALVQALVNDFIMPLLEYVVPDAAAWETITLGPFRVGHFFGALLTFLVIMLVIFGIIKAAKRFNVE